MMNKPKVMALIVLSALVLSLFAGSYFTKAKAVDLSSKISLTVKMPQNFTASDKDRVLIDIYKIADAEPVSGYDTYSLTLLDAYKSLDLTKTNKTGSTDWETISADAANIALKKGALQTPDVKGVALETAEDLTTVGPGLFLVVAHGTDSDYIRYPEKEGDLIETIASGEKVYYHFNPQLICIPDRFDEATGTSNTANNNIPWQYDAVLNLKASVEQKLGDVQIVKKLIAPEGVQVKPCTVIFNVVGVFNGQTVYEKEHAINFNGNSSDSILIKDLPCDTIVTVTEVYPGAGYAPTNPSTGVLVGTIGPETTITLSFENTLKTRIFGVGIINHFEYKNSEWQLTTPDKD